MVSGKTRLTGGLADGRTDGRPPFAQLTQSSRAKNVVEKSHLVIHKNLPNLYVMLSTNANGPLVPPFSVTLSSDLCMCELLANCKDC